MDIFFFCRCSFSRGCSFLLMLEYLCVSSTSSIFIFIAIGTLLSKLSPCVIVSLCPILHALSLDGNSNDLWPFGLHVYQYCFLCNFHIHLFLYLYKILNLNLKRFPCMCFLVFFCLLFSHIFHLHCEIVPSSSIFGTSSFNSSASSSIKIPSIYIYICVNFSSSFSTN
jgi:hypothetical protein